MKLSLQAKRMLQVIAIVNLIAAAALSLYYRSGKVVPHLLGLFLGGLSSAARVIILEKTVNRIVDKKVGGGLAQLSYLLRFALALVPLLIGAMVEQISLLGVIIGVLSYQLGTYSLGSTLSDKQNQIKEKISGTDQEEKKD